MNDAKLFCTLNDSIQITNTYQSVSNNMLANLLISLQMIYYFASLYFYIPWGFQISIHRCKSKYLCHYLNLRREMKIYAHKINEFLLFSKLYNFIYLYVYNIANMHIIFIYIHGYFT